MSQTTHPRRPGLLGLPALLLLVALGSAPALAQGNDGGAGSIPTCGGGEPMPVTLTWLEAPSPTASNLLHTPEVTLELANGTREDLEAHVVLTLDRAGEIFEQALPPRTVAAGSRQALAVDLTAGQRQVPGDSTSFAGAHAYFVRTDRTTMTQVSAPPLAFYADGSGAVAVFGEAELERRLSSRGTPESHLLADEDFDPKTTLEMVFQVDGSQSLEAPETFDLDAALAYEAKLASSRQNARDEEINP